MATEKRLIDANALRKEIDLCDIETFNDMFTICEQIANAPTVDAVEVVRCKDCRHWIERTVDGVDTFHICWFNGSITGRTHFCVYGERLVNETD